MAQTLLAILFATSSSNDQTIAFRWPASPRAFPRLARPRPPSELEFAHVDAPYRAAKFSDGAPNVSQCFSLTEDSDRFEYEWQRPTMKRYRSHSFASSGRSSSEGRQSPVNQRGDPHTSHANGEMDEYETTLGFNVNLLAHFLCPRPDNCHQKFELVVDDLAFIGHPVCVNEHGKWSFKSETSGETFTDDLAVEGTKDAKPTKANAESSSQSMLQLFHVVFVLDLPDPSSSASGNLNKYFDVIYQTVTFSLTAVLFNEQVLHNYVENQWSLLVKLREDCISNADSFDDYVKQCLKQSSLARSFEHIYTHIRANSLARLTLNNISLDLQLPPFLDSLLRIEPSDPSDSACLSSSGYGYGYGGQDEDERGDEDYPGWGPELSFGWRLPALTPWKSLLLLDVDPQKDKSKADPLQNLNRPGLTREEREIAEGITRFLDNSSVFVSLNDMAILLDWDLFRQVFPTVRYLVQRRRAKVVDLVRSSLKSIFTLPVHIETPMYELAAAFTDAFPNLPSLHVIFARLSSSPDNFFETVVRSKEQIPVYQNVVIWLLKRDLLMMLHMRFRLIASPALKQVAAAIRKEKCKARECQRSVKSMESPSGRGKRRKSSAEGRCTSPSVSRSRSLLRSVGLAEHDEEALEDESGGEAPFPAISQLPVRQGVATPQSFRSPSSMEQAYEPWGPASLMASEYHRRRRRFSDTPSPAHSRLRTRRPGDRDRGWNELQGEEGDEADSDSESDPDDLDDQATASLIPNPERATPKERRWLRAMSIGKNPTVTKRFEEIHKYFDGKKTVDEILYKAEISRKQLREVLHHFTDHITSFLHP